jgi:inositol-polyphosphate multikinase
MDKTLQLQPCRRRHSFRSMTYHTTIQAAGHDGALQNESGELFIKPTNQQEIDFYTAIARDDELQYITFLYMGTLFEQQLEQSTQLISQVTDAGNLGQLQDLAVLANKSDPIPNSQVCIVLENGLHGYNSPSVIDVKLGSILWDENAPAEKRTRLDQVSRTTTSGSLGYRISGMNIYNNVTKTRHEYDRWFGRSLTAENIVEKGLARMFPEIGENDFPGQESDLAIAMRQVMVDSVLEELQYIYQILEQRELRMVSGSVLIVYEGDLEEFHKKFTANINWAGPKVDDKTNDGSNDGNDNDEHDDDNDIEEEDEDNRPPPYCTVKLIDFAHTKLAPGLGADKNSLDGLRNLIKGIRQLADKWS